MNNNVIPITKNQIKKSRLEWDCEFRKHGPLITKEEYFAENRKMRERMEEMSKPLVISDFLLSPIFNKPLE